MPLIPLNIPAGVYRNGTEYQAANRWRDANLVRWHEGALRPIGGWRQFITADVDDACRGACAWSDNSGNKWLATGSKDALYVMDDEGATFDITPTGLTTGREDASVFTGFGALSWGSFEWGTERPETGIVNPATSWALDNWGEYLLALSDEDGKIYEWQLNTGTAAAVLSNAPTNSKSMMVTEERFVFALGAGGDPRKVQWSDRENNNSWTPATTNEAGDILLQTTGQILCGVRTKNQSLILTSQDAHTATYQGPPFVYGFEQVGQSCGIISQHAAASVSAGAMWMGNRAFFVFNGSQVQELPCEVADYVFSDINRNQKSKVFAVVNSRWGEVWWFYPSGSSTEIDRYVAYDYTDNVWNTGNLARTAGVDLGVFATPLWLGSDGTIYEHESGRSFDSQTPFAETGPIALGAGDNIIHVTDLIPDEKTQGDVSVTFKTRYYPNDTEYSHGPYTPTNPTSVRFNGRQFRMRVEGDATADWRLGIMRVDGKQGGRR